jgi:hypothetical protein
VISHGWPKIFWSHSDYSPLLSLSILWANDIRIGYSIPDHSIWKRMPWGEAEMHSFSYTDDQVLYNQFSPYFLCRVSWLPIITNLDSLSQIRLNEYQLKSISFNYNICGIWAHRILPCWFANSCSTKHTEYSDQYTFQQVSVALNRNILCEYFCLLM